MSSPDIVIIGSGMGGATLASALAGSGATVTILERGERLAPTPAARDPHAIFVERVFRIRERWLDGAGRPVWPSHNYCVGGNTKFYGAILMRYRADDFGAKQLFDGVSPAWPFGYDEMEPWYSAAEQLYQVRGTTAEDPTEPFHSLPYPHPPVPDEPDIARFRAQLSASGLHPASLPLGIDIERWLADGATPWDGFPNTGAGKMDAETCGLRVALAATAIRLETGALVERLELAPDRRRIAAVHYVQHGERRRLTPKLVVLSAGAINSAALLLRSDGAANRSDQVGRNFMNHNGAGIVAIDPRRRNRATYQKTIHFNDFYFGDGNDPRPLGNFQMVGKVSGAMLRPSARFLPRPALDWMAGHSLDCFVMGEDWPHPDSRVTVEGDRIRLSWRRTNLEAIQRLKRLVRARLRALGYPIVLMQEYAEANPGHQCGTVRMGLDRATAPLDPDCRAFDQPNLYVVDGGFLPNSAAVNPSLTIAAMALRVGARIRATG